MIDLLSSFLLMLHDNSCHFSQVYDSGYHLTQLDIPNKPLLAILPKIYSSIGRPRAKFRAGQIGRVWIHIHSQDRTLDNFCFLSLRDQSPGKIIADMLRSTGCIQYQVMVVHNT